MDMRHGSLEMTCRLIIVDDNRDCADSLAILLQYDGYDVRVAYDGQSALDIITTFCPHVAILDLGMPRLDGYEVARRIREKHDRCRITLVAITAWGDDVERRRTKEAGFEHHLSKPAEIDDVRRVLAKYVSQSRARSQCCSQPAATAPKQP